MGRPKKTIEPSASTSEGPAVYTSADLVEQQDAYHAVMKHLSRVNDETGRNNFIGALNAVPVEMREILSQDLIFLKRHRLTPHQAKNPFTMLPGSDAPWVTAGDLDGVSFVIEAIYMTKQEDSYQAPTGEREDGSKIYPLVDTYNVLCLVPDGTTIMRKPSKSAMANYIALLTRNANAQPPQPTPYDLPKNEFKFSLRWTKSRSENLDAFAQWLPLAAVMHVQNFKGNPWYNITLDDASIESRMLEESLHGVIDQSVSE